MTLVVLSFITFAVSPLLSLPITLWGVLCDKKYKPYFGLVLALFVGYILYHVEPDITKDLYRYISTMEEFLSYSFSTTIKDIWNNSDPLSYTIMYLVSLIFSPKYIVFIAPIICYPIYLWIISDYTKRKSVNNTTEKFVVISFLVIFAIATTFLGIRYGIAVAVFILALYQDSVRKRPFVGIVLYITSTLLHSSMVLVVMLRALLFVFKNIPWLWYVLVVLSATSVLLMQSLAKNLSNVPFLSTLSDRADVYTQPYAPIGMVYFLSIGISIIATVLLVLFRKYAKDDNKLSTIFHLNLTVFVIGLVNVQNYYLASRYFTIGKILFCITLIPILSGVAKIENSVKRKTVAYVLWSDVIILMTLSAPLQINGILDYHYNSLSKSLLINELLIH